MQRFVLHNNPGRKLTAANPTMASAFHQALPNLELGASQPMDGLHLLQYDRQYGRAIAGAV